MHFPHLFPSPLDPYLSFVSPLVGPPYLFPPASRPRIPEQWIPWLGLVPSSSFFILPFSLCTVGSNYGRFPHTASLSFPFDYTIALFSTPILDREYHRSRSLPAFFSGHYPFKAPSSTWFPTLHLLAVMRENASARRAIIGDCTLPLSTPSQSPRYAGYICI